MPVGPNRLLLNLEVSEAVAKDIAARATPTGKWVYGGSEGGNIKIGQLVDDPPEQIMVRCLRGGLERGAVISRPRVLISIRGGTPNILTVKPTVKMVIDLFHQQSPNLQGMALQFWWDGHEDYYRDQNRLPVFPLEFTTIGHALVGAA